jgi:peptidoglycan/LPS O-acetylase OafA/YrhL
MVKTKNRYLELDAFRGIAAIIVVIFHFSLTLEDGNEVLFKWGITGVDLFFIISGFVIALSINHVSKGTEFAINRFSRLYPTYWASVTFTFSIMCLHNYYTDTELYVGKYLANMTMFQYYLGFGDLDGPYWTMIVEMLFYVLILILYQLNILKHIKIIGVLICSITVILACFFWSPSISYLFTSVPLIQFFPLFFAGMLFYKIITKKDGAFFNYALLLFCLACQVVLFPYVGRSRIYLSQWDYAILISIYFSIFMFFVEGKLKFIAIKPLLFLGKISFALYLTHYYISTRHVIPFFKDYLGINWAIVFFAIALPICLVTATIITYFIEIPYNKKIRAQLNKINATFA